MQSCYSVGKDERILEKQAYSDPRNHWREKQNLYKKVQLKKWAAAKGKWVAN